MIEVIVNDRLGKKVRIKANPTDTVGDFKKLVAAQTGTRYKSTHWYEKERSPPKSGDLRRGLLQPTNIPCSSSPRKTSDFGVVFHFVPACAPLDGL